MTEHCVERFGLITCVEGGLGQVVKQLFLGRSALDMRIEVGKVRQDVVDVKVYKVLVGRGLEVTVKEQQEQGRVEHEQGEVKMTER